MPCSFDPREDRDIFPGSSLLTINESQGEVVIVGIHGGRTKDKEWHHHGTLLVPYLATQGLLGPGDKAGMGRRRRVSTYEACGFDLAKPKVANEGQELRLQASPRPTLTIPRDQYGLTAYEASRMEFRSAYMLLQLLQVKQH